MTSHEMSGFSIPDQDQQGLAGMMVSMRIPAALSAIRPLSEIVRSVVTYLSDDVEFISKVEIGVAEAVNNIIMHGYAGIKNGYINIEIKPAAEYVCVVLSDAAPRFNPLEALKEKDVEVDLGMVTEQSLGMGVQIIMNAMDHIEYMQLPNGNQLVMYKSMPNKQIKNRDSLQGDDAGNC